MTGRTAFYCKLFEQPGLDLYQRAGSAMNKGLIARGVLAGAVGGLVAFAFIMVSAGPIVGHAINLAGVRMQPAAVVDDHGVELFSPSMQAIGELAFVVVSFGIAMGVLLAVAFAITYAHIESVRPLSLDVDWGPLPKPFARRG
jgi:Probable cobalt transporter subunit (CbtA)